MLEIGFGMGTDHLNMARRGARMTGIDITPRNFEVTSRRFEIYEKKTDLVVGDGENLPYKDESLDFVYSFGVVHHTPDTDAAISEIHRVLKPGGKCYLTVYHKTSIFFWWSVFFCNFILGRGFRRRTLKQQISMIEYPNTNENMVIRLYKKLEFEKLFENFGNVKAYIRHLIPVDITHLSGLYGDKNKPTPLLTRIGNRFGWYVVVEAEK